MCVNLGWIIYVWVDSSFEYILEEFWFGVFTISEASEVDIEERRTVCQLNLSDENKGGRIHVSKVKEANMP